ncbi:MAG: ferredoxin oxidoreductase [Euryarchaeota archaeon]|nr:ferredoxin oxidoreductase [Euryarchaeota archaeon]|tara:strand:- start:1136 stop:2923 length:1788 start_codon:yes stop_codon:yes gene_type:complete
MDKVVNDFTINIATANGTGSQSANLILLQTLFDMGIPVSGKNLFPSNISGLPTWYIVRLSEKGYQAPGDRTHIQILVNPATWEEDLASLEPGTVVIWNMDSKMPMEREDVISYPVPMTKIARKLNPKLARMIANVVYVGVLAELLGMDQEVLEAAISKQFGGKAKAIELNAEAARLGRAYCAEELTKSDNYTVESREIEEGGFFIEGNEAIALGSVFGGIQMLGWYPITPSSSVAEGIISWLPKLRTHEGKATYAVIQAEDELAAAGMIIGAGWAGARGLTATSGPGISLMQEFIGLAYFAEVPCVFWDVNRVGPSTGLPTRTQQGDLTMVYESSHGDTKHIVFIPGTVEECFEFGWKVFDASEKYQTPVFGFSDLDLGMNKWACRGFEYPDESIDRGKVVLTQEQMDSIENYGRYRDVDGDGIPYRTLPGSGLDPILYRGTGHDEDGTYSEKPDVYYKLMQRLGRKIDGARDYLPAPIIKEDEEQELGVIFYGSMENTIDEIEDIVEEKSGKKISTCRVRALPLHSEVEAFMEKHEKIIVVEINRDAQLYGIMRKEYPLHLLSKMLSVAYSDGMPPRGRLYAERILEAIEEAEI